MIGYVEPHSVYPNGYHWNPKLPLPFINIGSQKNFIVLHHLGIYGSNEILDWFVAEYPKHAKHKLDMCKGCVRFKKINEIPFLLIEELIKKISLEKYIAQYEANIKNNYWFSVLNSEVKWNDNSGKLSWFVFNDHKLSAKNTGLPSLSKAIL